MRRALSQVEKDMVEVHFDRVDYVDAPTLHRVLDRAQVSVGFPHPHNLGIDASDATAFLGSLEGKTAFALNDTIYIQPGITYEDDSLPLRTLLHEVVHLIQQDELGRDAFLGQYLSEYRDGLLKGKSVPEAREGISLERDATSMETTAGQDEYTKAKKRELKALEQRKAEQAKAAASEAPAPSRDWSFDSVALEPSPVKAPRSPSPAPTKSTNLPVKTKEKASKAPLIVVGVGALALYLLTRGKK